MTRRILLSAAIAAAAIVPAPAANAGQVCVRVIVTGLVNQAVGPCVTIGPATWCDSQTLGAPPLLTVSIVVCTPVPVGE